LRNAVGKKYTYKSWKSWSGKYSDNSNIGRELLHEIAETYPPKNASFFKQLTENDIFWDKIKTIKKRSFSGYVYDLSVPGTENFVCNNIIAHNTRELQLPNFLHWVPLTTREPNPEGKGGVSMLDLLVNSLRMRPDRIIVGEIRRQREAEVMFEGMHTGHSVYTTVHANTAAETVRRLTNPPIEVPTSMLDAVNLNVVMFRNRRLGVRRMLQVAEFILEKSEKQNEERLKPNLLYRWKSSTDKIQKYSDSIRLFDELSLHTGLNFREITQELSSRKKLLDWMVDKNIRAIEDVGKTIAEYSKDSDALMEKVLKKK
jgi:archaeal flagellar protein FlaI